MTFYIICGIIFSLINKLGPDILDHTIIYMKGCIMAVSYDGLWKLLIDKKLKKTELSEKLNISSATMAKMSKGESVSLDVLGRICEHLGCDIGDIMSFEKNLIEEDK